MATTTSISNPAVKPEVATSSQTAPMPPYHLLMSEDAKKALAGQRRLDRKLQRDYLSKRQRAFQEASINNAASNSEEAKRAGAAANDTSDDALWSGASMLERAMISCCTVGGCNNSTTQQVLASNEHEDDDMIVIGALQSSKIAQFVALIALHGHDAASRALALAILERTQELDERLLYRHELACAEIKAIQDAAAGISGESSSDEPSARRARVSDDGVAVAAAPAAASSSPTVAAVPVKPPPRRRVLQFLAAGGLRLLSRWLVEASSPVPPPVKPTTSGRLPRQRVATATQPKNCLPSSTGPLLLPLLQFLQRIPFDKHLVTQSKVNKEIRNLSKQVDAVVTAAQQQQAMSLKKLQALTDPVAGGLPVLLVQQAVKQVKEVWAEQHAKQKDSLTIAAHDATELAPEAGTSRVQKLLRERLQQLDSNDKPEWLIQAQNAAAAQSSSQGSKNKRASDAVKRPSTEQMARRERENERAFNMKQDLEKAQRERQEILRRLRHMQNQKKAVEEQRAAEEQVSISKRRVQWKDGLGPASKLRKRELLEEVRVYVKDQDRLAKDNEDEDEVEESPSSVAAPQNDEDDHLEDEVVTSEDGTANYL